MLFSTCCQIWILATRSYQRVSLLYLCPLTLEHVTPYPYSLYFLPLRTLFMPLLVPFSLLLPFSSFSHLFCPSFPSILPSSPLFPSFPPPSPCFLTICLPSSTFLALSSFSLSCHTLPSLPSLLAFSMFMSHLLHVCYHTHSFPPADMHSIHLWAHTITCMCMQDSNCGISAVQADPSSEVRGQGVSATSGVFSQWSRRSPLAPEKCKMKQPLIKFCVYMW